MASGGNSSDHGMLTTSACVALAPTPAPTAQAVSTAAIEIFARPFKPLPIVGECRPRRAASPGLYALAVPLPQSRPGRIAAILAAAVVLLLVVTQLFLPGIGEGAIEDRLTEGGGVADVSLGAIPAARLLWGDGDRIAIAATGLDLDLDEPDPDAFENLDRFGDVEVVVSDSRVGPVEIETFLLTRDGDEEYSLESRGASSVADLAEFFAAEGELPGADIVGGIIGATGIGGADIDVELDMKLESDEGRVQVVDGGGEVAGIPTGPLAELITQAILVRL